MPSKCIHVGARLFHLAQQEGVLMSRSTAQQIEHWARLGAEVEAAGLSVTDVASLLRGADLQHEETASEQDLWAFTRERQAKDRESVRAGRQPADAMSWFSGGKAKAAKLVNLPY
jgi:hypothetical protein